VHLDFDPAKARANLKKHGVSFEEAATLLLDEQALAMEDPGAENERRWVLVGISRSGRILTVVYTLRGQRIRLISARKATRRESRIYAKGI
jgi:uncharacterized DUF497 family protein